MKISATILTAAFLTCLTGCQNPTGTSPLTTVTATAMNTVDAAEVALTAAEQTATLYTSLPVCTTPKTVAVCADAYVKQKIKNADQIAYAQVKAAEAGTATATQALTAVSALSSTIPVLPAAQPATTN